MDYHIYIHNEGGNGKKPTVPQGKGTPKPTKPNAMAALGKAAAPVAIAVATVKLAEKAVDTFNAFYTTATGDYRFKHKWDNMKAVVGAMLNPNTVENVLMERHQIAIANRKAQFQLELLGDSMINERTKKV